MEIEWWHIIDISAFFFGVGIFVGIFGIKNSAKILLLGGVVLFSFWRNLFNYNLNLANRWPGELQLWTGTNH